MKQTAKEFTTRLVHPTCCLVAAFLCLTAAPLRADGDIMNFDNQGKKLFDSYLATPEQNLFAGSSGRNLMQYYELRQYPGSPPQIPHEVAPDFSGEETECLSCHANGGYSQEFRRFIPVTPHPEQVLCYQCHAKPQTTKLFVETKWQSIDTPRLGRSFLSSSPPPIPHSLQLRENCIACHTGPGAVTEIRVEHADRGNCRQCHVPDLQTAPLATFTR